MYRLFNRSWGSSYSMVTDYGMDGRSDLQQRQTIFLLSPQITQSDHEADNLPPSSAEVNNEWHLS
jgi:hypothetical protein